MFDRTWSAVARPNSVEIRVFGGTSHWLPASTHRLNYSTNGGRAFVPSSHTLVLAPASVRIASQIEMTRAYLRRGIRVAELLDGRAQDAREEQDVFNHQPRRSRDWHGRLHLDSALRSLRADI